jgi:hypothetical protein
MLWHKGMGSPSSDTKHNEIHSEFLRIWLRFSLWSDVHLLGSRADFKRWAFLRFREFGSRMRSQNIFQHAGQWALFEFAYSTWEEEKRKGSELKNKVVHAANCLTQTPAADWASQKPEVSCYA